jgi:hypothetical protein
MVDRIQNHGKTLIKWHFPEFEQPERSLSWYIILFIIFAALLAYSITTLNFLFAIIVVMVVVILFLHQRKDPMELEIRITEAGIEIDNKFYAYKELDKFFIIYEPPEISNLYIEFKSNLKPDLSIPLKKENPIKVRDILINFLKEDIDQDEEPTSDFLTRWLKF